MNPNKQQQTVANRTRKQQTDFRLASLDRVAVAVLLLLLLIAECHKFGIFVETICPVSL